MSQVALPPFRVVNTLEVSGAVYALHAFQGRLLGAVSRPFLNVFFLGGGGGGGGWDDFNFHVDFSLGSHTRMVPFFLNISPFFRGELHMLSFHGTILV